MNQSNNKNLSKKEMKRQKRLQKMKQKQDYQKQEQQEQIQQNQQIKEAVINKNNQNKKQKPKKQVISTQKQQENGQLNEQNLDQNQDIDFNQLQNNEQVQSNINVTFLVAQIRQQYYHSMKTVLLRYGQILNITQSQIASQILQKANFGNVVIADDDQDQQEQQEQQSDQGPQEQDDQLNVYSIVSILPSNTKLSTKIKKIALSSLQKNKSKLQKQLPKLNEILSSPKMCGILINSRLPNLPSFMVAHSHQVFVSDLEQLKKQNSKSPVFQTQYILNISQVQITNTQSLQLDDLLFSKFQDYEFCKKSVKWWIGQNVKSQRQKADLRRLYYIIKRKDYLESVKNIRSYLQDGEEQKVQK